MTEAVLVVQVMTRQIVYWNTRAETLFGHTQEEALQQTTRHLYVDDAAFQDLYDRSTLRHPCARLLAWGGQSSNVETGLSLLGDR